MRVMSFLAGGARHLCLCVLPVLCAASIVSVAPAQGQAPAGLNDIVREQRQIIEREEQRRRRERGEFLGGSSEPSLREPDLLPETSGGDGPCLEVNRIVFDGAKRIPARRLETLVEGRQGGCLTLADIQNVLRLATNYYIDKGYVTSRAYLQPQDIGAGELRVLIVEGAVSDVRLLENGKARRGGWQLFGERTGRIMNIRHFEQGLEQINRLGSKQATIRIEPGRGVGESIVTIEVEDSYAIEASASLDNGGSTSTGRHQWNGIVGFEDVLGLHERLTVSARSSLDRLDDQIYSRSINGYLSVPWHYFTLNLSGSYLEYYSRLDSASGDYSYDGLSWEGRVELDRILHRTGRYTWRAGTAFTLKEATNYIEDIFIDASSQRLAVVEASTGISGRIAGGFGQASVAVKRGLDAFAAQSDTNQSGGTPVAQFTQATLSGFYQRVWKNRLGRLSVQATGYASWSPDTLFASERVNIGGPYSVRGFRDVSLSGDAGGYGQFELSLVPAFAAKTPESLQRVIGTPQVFAALDAGAVVEDADDPLEGGELMGGVVGLRLSGGILSGEVAYEKALVHPSFLKPADDGFLRFRIGISHRF
ncbi:ShlB/FhaC/HecB family hemolysin secretion/activation protein [Labrenzia sp. VG12]|uniref:ShlB/FhaC/HecB family hemolysin secretion/activation protein n=1 Tax=Labrenzia sp. VG12 TaxID=2021862 RepID=UPI000B8BDFF4|nr:ShlB/FhaC/HecB family hemolysin secretion/activation protein [Labrenzia sp. VG12]ASP35460.1 hypothetical protein CHH27_21270 [Labrenzia sp. VG12]